MHKPTRRFVLAIPCLLLAVAAAAAADWPRFRGPNGAGVAADATIPVSFKEGDGILWKLPLPGKGNSSPVISKGKLFLQAASDDGRQRQLLCLDAATGREIWARSAPGGMATIHKNNTLASSTPAADGERVYTLFWNGRNVALTGFDYQGNELWKQDLGPYKSQHGAGTSPMEYGGRIYVNYDQDGSAVLFAFDARTGTPAWQVERKGLRACYSVPIVRDTTTGGKELVVASTTATTGYDPNTGKELWTWTADFSYREKGPLRVVASPVAWKDMILIQYGDGDGSRHITAIRAGGAGMTPQLVWEYRKGNPYVPCMLVAGDHLYTMNDLGVAACQDIATGKILWSKDKLGTAYSASPVLIDGKVYAASGDGDVFVFSASPTGYKELARNALGEPVIASPAVADGRLYIRGQKHLFCIGK